MRIREHKSYGHGLPRGADSDINCSSCQREQAQGDEPIIVGADD